jgi:hypothetical protein
MPQTAPQRASGRTVGRARPAYVKPVSEEGQTIYAVFTGDGRLVGIAPTRALALVGARRHALEPVDAH